MMNRHTFAPNVLLALYMFFFLVACQSAQATVDSPPTKVTESVLQPLPSPSHIFIPVPTEVSLTTNTTKTPTSSPTTTTVHLSSPMVFTPVPLPQSTPPPLPIDSAYWPKLTANQYYLRDQATIEETESSFYTMYLLENTSDDPLAFNDGTSETCRLLFYNWQESSIPATRAEARFIDSYPAQPRKTWYGEDFPVECFIVNWDSYINWGKPTLEPIAPLHTSDTEREILQLDGVKSDINANGLPEFSLVHFYTPNQCIEGWKCESVHFFEIQKDGSVALITHNLPGEIVPEFPITYNGQAGTILVHDFGILSKWETASTWWIFKWDGTSFQDVTPQYSDDISQWGQRRLAAIREQYGTSIVSVRLDFVEMALQYEKASLRSDAVDIIMEVTDLVHWPGTDKRYQCWLMLLRENIVSEYTQGLPFSLPIINTGWGLEEGYDYPDLCNSLTDSNE